jgi:peroxiredoxin
MYLKSILFSALLLLIGSTTEKRALDVGDTAMDFNLKNVDGAMLSLKSNKEAKGYILVFTCNTCPYSVMYEDRIIALHERYAEKGYPVFAVQPNNPEKSPGDAFDKMQERAKAKGFPFPYALDITQEVTSTYGATNTPHVYILNKQADESFRIEYIGAIDNNSRNAKAATKRYVEITVDALLAKTEIITTKTKAIGCTIKWAD